MPGNIRQKGEREQYNCHRSSCRKWNTGGYNMWHSKKFNKIWEKLDAGEEVRVAGFELIQVINRDTFLLKLTVKKQETEYWIRRHDWSSLERNSEDFHQEGPSSQHQGGMEVTVWSGEAEEGAPGKGSCSLTTLWLMNGSSRVSITTAYRNKIVSCNVNGVRTKLKKVMLKARCWNDIISLNGVKTSFAVSFPSYIKKK